MGQFKQVIETLERGLAFRTKVTRESVTLVRNASLRTSTDQLSLCIDSALAEISTAINRNLEMVTMSVV
jgi:hypothetical protein